MQKLYNLVDFQDLIKTYTPLCIPNILKDAFYSVRQKRKSHFGDYFYYY